MFLRSGRRSWFRLGSPKLKKGLAQEFDPKAYDPKAHEVVCDITPYMEDQEQRIGAATQNIRPQRITSVAWLTSSIGNDEAARIVERAKASGRLNFVVSRDARQQVLAEAAGVGFIHAADRPGKQVLAEIKGRGRVRDWILLMRDSAPSDAMLELLGKCVFNPGCLYWRASGKTGFQFFNVRAYSLRGGGNIFDIAAAYPERKQVLVSSDDAARYSLSPAHMFYRRAVKRLNWARKRISRKAGQQPPSESIGPKGPLSEVGVASN